MIKRAKNYFLLAIVIIMAGCVNLKHLDYRETNCDTIDLHDKGEYFFNTFRDYVKFKLLDDINDSIYLKGRIQMKKISPAIQNDSVVSFYWGSGNSIVIKKKKISIFDLNKVVYDSIQGIVPKFIHSINDKIPYGFRTPEDSSEIICEFKVVIGGKDIDIPTSRYDNLYFPNFRDCLPPIRPVELYLDDMSNVNIYVFGRHLINKGSPKEVDFYESYMSRIIIPKKDAKVVSFIAGIDVLRVYKWWCKSFQRN